MIVVLTMFGGARISINNLNVTLKLPPSALMLLCYLALQKKKRRPREVVLNTFWPDLEYEKAGKCLNTTIWRLRKAFNMVGVKEDVISSASCTDIALAGGTWLRTDVDEFCNGISCIVNRGASRLDSANIASLEQAMKLYTGHLLDGIYADWALEERENLHQFYLEGLAALGRYYHQEGDFQRTIDHLRTLVRWDPLREDAHGSLIDAYLAAGRRTLALQQYEACRRALKEELNVVPCAELKARRNWIIGTPPESPTAPSASYAELFDLIESALDTLNSTYAQLLVLTGAESERPRTKPKTNCGRAD